MEVTSAVAKLSRRRAWGVAIGACALALGSSFAACGSTHHEAAADAGAGDGGADVNEEEAAADSSSGPLPDVHVLPDAPNLLPDGCPRIGTSCTDNGQCCSDEYCYDGGCELTTRQQ